MIKNLCPNEKPRERCLRSGPETLSLRECLAIILGSGPKGEGCLGLAFNLIDNGSPVSDESFFLFLENMQKADVQQQKGMGPASHARLLATFEIAKRYGLFKLKESTQNLAHEGALDEQMLSRIPMGFRYSNEEALGLIAQTSRGSLSPFVTITTGDDISVQTSKRKLLQILISLKAECFWLFHNHPDHDLTPSQQDLEFTQSLRVLSKVISIPLRGHWIVGHGGALEVGNNSSVDVK